MARERTEGTDWSPPRKPGVCSVSPRAHGFLGGHPLTKGARQVAPEMSVVKIQGTRRDRHVSTKAA